MEILTASEAARYLKLSERTLCSMRARGDGPAFTRISPSGRGIRYRVADLENWINEKGALHAA